MGECSGCKVLEKELALNARMLAKQCDLAREAEVAQAQAEAKLAAVVEAGVAQVENHLATWGQRRGQVEVQHQKHLVALGALLFLVPHQEEYPEEMRRLHRACGCRVCTMERDWLLFGDEGRDKRRGG